MQVSGISRTESEQHESWRLVVRVDEAPCCDQHFGRNCTKKISSSSLMVGICHLTDSHHNHHGQKPTMVGICHGGNMLGNQNSHDDQVRLAHLWVDFRGLHLENLIFISRLVLPHLLATA